MAFSGAIKDREMDKFYSDSTGKTTVRIGGEVEVIDTPSPDYYIKNTDVYSASVTYTGLAKIGSLDTDFAWQITKTETVDTVTTIRYAEGTSKFTNAWSERLTLVYS